MVTIPPRKSKVPNILGDWDDVRFFLAVAKTGSFSAAATQLNTKQTTVGRRIQALERRLGAKLFDRHRHGYQVTAIVGLRVARTLAGDAGLPSQCHVSLVYLHGAASTGLDPGAPSPAEIGAAWPMQSGSCSGRARAASPRHSRLASGW